MTHPFAFIAGALIGVAVGLLIYLQAQPQLQRNEQRHGGNRSRRRSNHESCGFEFVDSSNQCTICMDDIDSREQKYLNCGHSFHTKCVSVWLRTSNTCPNCKRPAL